MVNMRLTLAASILLVFLGNMSPAADPGSERAGVDSSRMRDYKEFVASLEHEWNAATKDVDRRTKEGWVKRTGELRQVIGACSAGKKDLLIYGLCKTATMSQFEEELLPEMVMALLDDGDRTRLVSLLAGRSLKTLRGFCGIEWTLALTMTPPDAILIIGESYKKATNAEVKKSLVEVYAGAFPAIRGRFPDDDAFVDEVGRWYRENKDRLAVNYDYFMHGGPPKEDDAVLHVERGPMELYILDQSKSTPSGRSIPQSGPRGIHGLPRWGTLLGSIICATIVVSVLVLCLRRRK